MYDKLSSAVCPSVSSLHIPYRSSACICSSVVLLNNRKEMLTERRCWCFNRNNVCYFWGVFLFSVFVLFCFAFYGSDDADNDHDDDYDEDDDDDDNHGDGYDDDDDEGYYLFHICCSFVLLLHICC